MRADEYEREKSAERCAINHASGQKPQAFLHVATDEFRLGTMPCCLQFDGFKLDRAFHRWLAEKSRKTDRQQSREDASKHPAKKQVSNHGNPLFSGRGSRK